MTSLARAGNKSIQGTVIGLDGKPVIGAKIQAQRLNGASQTTESKPVVSKTFGNGQFVFTDLAPGIYSVLVTVNGVPKSVAKIKTRTDGWVRVDFDLRPSANGNRTAQPSQSARPVVNDDLARMQRTLGGNMNSMSFPGH